MRGGGGGDRGVGSRGDQNERGHEREKTQRGADCAIMVWGPHLKNEKRKKAAAGRHGRLCASIIIIIVEIIVEINSRLWLLDIFVKSL